MLAVRVVLREISLHHQRCRARHTGMGIQALIGLTYRWLQVAFTTGGGHWACVLNTALLYGTLLYFIGVYMPCTTADDHPLHDGLVQVRLVLHTIAC